MAREVVEMKYCVKIISIKIITDMYVRIWVIHCRTVLP